jgi:hypothetical protein
MSKHTVLTVLRNLLKRAGLSDTDQFSGHRFRKEGPRAYATQAFPSRTSRWRLGATIHYTASGSAVCPIDVTKSLAHTWAASDPSAPAFPDANGRPMSKRTVLTVLENLLKRAGLSDTD